MKTQAKNINLSIIITTFLIVGVLLSFPVSASALIIYVPTITVSINGIVRTSTAELSRFSLKRNDTGEGEHEHDNATNVEPTEQEEGNTTTAGNEDAVVTIISDDPPKEGASDNSNGGATAGSGGDGGRGDRGGSVRSGGAVTNSNGSNNSNTTIHDIFVNR